MGGGTVNVGRFAGIQVGIHYTWLFAFVLIAWSLAEGFFPFVLRGLGTPTYWLMGAIAALLLFLSVLIHEFSHSLVAIARGLEVHSITLFIFGGVSTIKGEARNPRDEFLIAVVGPLTSFVLAGLFWAASQVLRLGQTPVGAIVSYLAFINLLLGAFNLLPGFPLDGGRVLRSLIWGVTGSLRRATQVASYVGQGFGILLMAVGLFQVFSGNFLNGLWTAFIGWFLNSAAESTRRQQTLEENLRGFRVAEVMNPSPPTIAPWRSVQDFVLEDVVRRGQRAALVVDDAGVLAGLMSVTDAKELPQEEWGTTPIERVMTRSPLKMVAPDSELTDGLKLLVDGEFNQVPVVQDGRVVGLLSRADILRFLQINEELGLRRRGRRPERANPSETAPPAHAG